ncbi:MAG: ATP-binding protein [Chloroflexota bacterium]|nr:ATP-binding protein [Chloroflexota bacterium]
MSNIKRKPERFLGVITSGSFAKGLQARIRTLLPLEQIRIGQFVAIESAKVRFFGMINDVLLGATSQAVLLDPPTPDDDTPALVREVLQGVYTYGEAHIQPSLALTEGEKTHTPVRSVPPHFTPVYLAEEEDFNEVFGAEDITQPEGRHFAIGRPLDMEIDICLDLERFVERSNGIFGKSGTGKSVLTRLVLAGLVRGNVCANLIFDMHNEYGEGSQSEGPNPWMRGLKSLFPTRVMVFSLRDRKPGSAPARREQRTARSDGDLIIGLNQVEVEDILMLRHELDLSPAAADTAYLLQEKLGQNWLNKFLEMDLDEAAELSGAHEASLKALHRKLRAKVVNLPFIDKEAGLNQINLLVNALENGRHVVVEFGSSDNLLSYILVANIITRQIHDAYRQKFEKYNRTKNAADRPNRVMITIEEAHKFLTPEVANQTIFGTIAREMRKYNVTLLVVDQRPSSIDNEILSQIGTRVVALINDERDIDAVFTGISGASGLKTVLASLDSRQQALVLGHAAPMPVVIRTRSFDEQFCNQITKGLSALSPLKATPSSNGDHSDFDDWEEKVKEEWEEKVKKDESDLFE